MQLVLQRGLCAEGEIATYLSPSLQSLDDPGSMADMDKAVTRILTAITAGETLTVYGDYDVDGVCATTVLVDFLKRVMPASSESASSDKVRFYIPDRRAEGYGLNRSAVLEIATHSSLLITADCGITAIDEVAAARKVGLDVIIVDHHKVPTTLPNANAALNPQRTDCRFPFKGLCAAGVAFMLVVALRRALRDSGHFGKNREPDVRDLLDVVALATVADMVPLRGLNRTLVCAGLKRIGSTQRVGLRALLDVAEVVPTSVNAGDIGFRIGPRINARGRLAHAAEAVELLLTGDEQRARILASALDVANRERRTVEKTTTEAALAQAEALGLAEHAIIVAHDPAWHPGVLGLVASRLVSRYRRPAMVIGEGGKGSARSIEGFNIHDAIAENAGFLIRYGGHHAAAGVTIDVQHVEAFRASMDVSVRRVIGAPPFVATVRLDLEIPARELSLGMVDELQRLAPFGQDNPEPMLVLRELEVREKRVVGDNHLKISFRSSTDDIIFDGIGFGMGELASALPARVDAAFRLERNVFRGRETVQLKLEDLRASEAA
ncbi:MAG: single-stranded-DNA-specific exonuclease RecJ [Clostridia bacterium]|nr:single-stranded-DNA-specific exonuclease RecJ [Deltaproteobacteria bacterium]